MQWSFSKFLSWWMNSSIAYLGKSLHQIGNPHWIRSRLRSNRFSDHANISVRLYIQIKYYFIRGIAHVTFRYLVSPYFGTFSRSLQRNQTITGIDGKWSGTSWMNFNEHHVFTFINRSPKDTTKKWRQSDRREIELKNLIEMLCSVEMLSSQSPTERSRAISLIKQMKLLFLLFLTWNLLLRLVVEKRASVPICLTVH